MQKGRILALDYGERRIGLAMSDPLRIIVSGSDTLTVRSDEEAIPKIVRVAAELGITLIVLGMPIEKSGHPGPQARRVSAFGEKLSAVCTTPMVHWDERLSTVSAKKLLLEVETKKKRRTKERLDALAATVLLRSYLDYLQNTIPREP